MVSSAADDPAHSGDDFIAHVSHELRSPLNAIRGWAHVLRKSGGLSAMQERALDTIDRNVSIQARMIDDLLDHQRLLRGALVLERRTLRLDELLDAAIVEARAASNDRQVTFEIDTDREAVVNGDPQRLTQVLVSVLGGALRTAPGGSRVSLRLRADPAAATLDVSGSRFDLEPAQDFGLALATRLIALHGGRIERCDDGARLRLSMPVAPAGTDPRPS